MSDKLQFVAGSPRFDSTQTRDKLKLVVSLSSISEAFNFAGM